MGHFPGLSTASCFIAAASAIDIWDEARAGDVAVARCTLTEMLANEHWVHPMLDDFHHTLVRATSDVLENESLRPRLIHFIGQEYSETDVDDIVNLAHHRYDKFGHPKRRDQILPTLRTLIGNLLDDHVVRNPENRELGLAFCLALSRQFMAQHQSEGHMRSLNAWAFHQESRGFSDPFDRYSNTGRCH